MSNILKSHNVLVNQEKRFMLQKRVQVVHYQTETQNSLQEYKQKSDEAEEHSILDIANQEAENILAKAMQEGKSIVAAAALEAQQIKQKAQQEGFQAGFEEGIQKAKELFLSELDEVQRIKDDIITEREKLYYQFERDLVNLAVDIAKRVVYDRLETDDEILKHIVESTLQKVQGKVKVQLRISTHDYQKIVHLKDRFISKLQSLENIEIIEDELISAGSCIVETGNGVIDGSIQTRMKEIETALSGG